MGRNRFSRTGVALLAAFFFAIAMAVVIACGSGDEPPTSVPVADDTGNRPRSIVDAFADPDDTGGDRDEGADTPKMAEVLVAPVVEPEAGSDEAAILEVFRGQIRALNLNDWQGFLEACDPRLARLNTPEKVEMFWVLFIEPYAPALAYNRRNAKIVLFSDELASVTSDRYSYDKSFFTGELSDAVTESWVKVDGNWYLSNVMCHGGNARLK